MCIRIVNCLIICMLSVTAMAQQRLAEEEVIFKKIRLAFSLTPEGVPTYSVFYDNIPVVTPSEMGFVLADNIALDRDFEYVNTERSSVQEHWNPVWGEEKTIQNNYEELKVSLRQKKAPYRLLNIIFRVFADGVGFRYEFPRQHGVSYFTIQEERTFFRMIGDHTAFWIPGDYDTNEYPYSTTRLSEVDNTTLVTNSADIAVRTAPDARAVQTPLMMKTQNGLYINIHEAALINYPAMQLQVDPSSYRLLSQLVPDVTGYKAWLKAPFNTPWRTIVVSNDAREILSSRMILNLNEPCALETTDWIRPMKYVGVWWEMQTGRSSWNYYIPDSTDAMGNPVPASTHGANTANVKRYIDFAAQYGFDGVLVEGWNTGWEDWFGNWKEEVFDFVTPYPDFDIAEINRYAHSKGVKMIMHHETSGSATGYERQIDTAFKLMQQFRYPAVKTGYVGKIIPRGEHHDGQWMSNHFRRVAEKAAAYKIMLNVHEPPRPTGQHRTWPHWLASEAGRGNEYNAFSNGTSPDHETILPFTRLMGGPMDYTPGIFKLTGYAAADPQRQMHSTLAKQLALYVTMYSPLQMAADLPENYLDKPDAFQFIIDVPVEWDTSLVIAAEPGDYLAIARKEKSNHDWYIGAVTDEQARTLSIPLNFLEPGKKYQIALYLDAKDAHWKSNPEAYSIEHYWVDAKTVLKLSMAPGGGAAVQIKPIEKSAAGKLKKYK